jgi:proline dehydrogenase
MLRSTLLYFSRQRWLRHWIETSSVSRRLTSRFIAGRTLEDGIRVAGQLAKDRIFATLDFLGENVTSRDEALRSRDSYLEALEAIKWHGLGATVSVKLTQLGLNLSEEACLNNVSALVERAKAMDSRIEVDMESSAYTDRTLRLVTELHTRFGGARPRRDSGISPQKRRGYPPVIGGGNRCPALQGGLPRAARSRVSGQG